MVLSWPPRPPPRAGQAGLRPLFWAGPASPASGIRTRKTNSPDTYGNSLAPPTPQSPLPRPRPAFCTKTVPCPPESTELSWAGPGSPPSPASGLKLSQSKPLIQSGSPRGWGPGLSLLSPQGSHSKPITTSYSPRKPGWETAQIQSLPPCLPSSPSRHREGLLGWGNLGWGLPASLALQTETRRGTLAAARDGGPGTPAGRPLLIWGPDLSVLHTQPWLPP